MNCIDYTVIAQAVKAYEALGYKPIEVPWWATSEVINITKPVAANSRSDYQVSVNGKYLLASGEQGFLYLANKGQLPPGRYQTVTPCFRNEPYDETHSKQFMKLELIELLPGPFNSMLDANAMTESIVKEALAFMTAAAGVLPNEVVFNLRTNQPFIDHVAYSCKNGYGALVKSDQTDIELGVLGREGEMNDLLVELGSYGTRQTSFAAWVYGTGVAEPRFSKTVKRFSQFTR